MMYHTYKCKKMYAGRVSVRSCEVDYCKRMGYGLRLWFQGKECLIPFEKLNDNICDGKPYFAKRSDKFIKKGEIYNLYDYIFNVAPTLFEITPEESRLANLQKLEAIGKALKIRQQKT